MRVTSSLFLGVSLLLSACGGSSKPAEEPAADSESKDEASDKDAAESEEKAGSDTEKSADKEEGKTSSGDKATSSESTSAPSKRAAKDIVTAPDIIFMFSFNESDMKDEAEKECDKQSKDDPKKRADCMTRAKKNIEIDGMAFKEEKGQWYWLSIKVKGKTLINLHKIPVEFVKETDRSVVLKPVGKDEGKLRGASPGETKVEVPNEYQIVFDDPKHGKMVYEAKIGLTGP